ncbi:MAG: FtsX-like permease family protein [Acidimicrobiales bacterium]
MTGVLEQPKVTVDIGRGEGGLAARRAVTRWAWRLFRREWRQQLLVLCLIVLAVAALVVGASVSTNSAPPANSGFGTAQYQANISGNPAHDQTRLSSLSHSYGTLDVIENDPTPVPGSLLTFDFRSQNPDGAFGQPMLQLLSGRYPMLPGEVAITQGVAQDFNLRVGSVWDFEGKRWLVEGMVQNPQSLLDEFALVAPGQLPLTSSTKVTALFDNPTGVAPTGSDIISAASANAGATTNLVSPATITLLLSVVGMMLIGLVAIAGFSVLAQRRLRSIGMLQSLGGTDRHVRLVVLANGAVVGIVGALTGAVLGFALWAAYRPHLESSSHHVIGLFQLPWTVLLIAGAIAMVTPFLAASRPARTITKVPIVKALSGRPAPPAPSHRSAIPGVVLLVATFALLGLAGDSNDGGGTLPLVLGFVCLIAAIILVAPFTVGLLGHLGSRLPITVRLALRDLARYRSRSASALAAISLGVLIAVVICVAASARYSDVLDYAGPNLASNQLVVTADSPPPPGSQCFGPKGSCPSQNTQYPPMATQTSVADGIARSLGASHGAVPLELAPVGLQYGAVQNGNSNAQFNGAIYVATPQLLRSLGVSQSKISPQADFLTMRTGLDTLGNMQMVWGNPGNPNSGPQNGPPTGDGSTLPCPRSSCVSNPVIQYLPQLPSGTSAPNTLVTEHALSQVDLQSQASVSGWLISTAGPLTAGQISDTRATASTAQLTIETKNDQPSSWEVVNWATVFGVALALAILAMTVGLIRAETASDLRTLAATGASSWSRRSITAVTAGGLATLGMLLGAAGGYLACAGYFQAGKFGESVFGNLSHVPLPNLFIIVVGLPVVATVGGFVFSGRQQSLMSRQPIE